MHPQKPLFRWNKKLILRAYCHLGLIYLHKNLVYASDFGRLTDSTLGQSPSLIEDAYMMTFIEAAQADGAKPNTTNNIARLLDGDDFLPILVATAVSKGSGRVLP